MSDTSFLSLQEAEPPPLKKQKKSPTDHGQSPTTMRYCSSSSINNNDNKITTNKKNKNDKQKTSLIHKNCGAFYGVHRGRRTGVFTSWDQVGPLIEGYPNAQFKKFQTWQEAAAFAASGHAESAFRSDTFLVTTLSSAQYPNGSSVRTYDPHQYQNSQPTISLQTIQPHQIVSPSAQIGVNADDNNPVGCCKQTCFGPSSQQQQQQNPPSWSLPPAQRVAVAEPSSSLSSSVPHEKNHQALSVSILPPQQCQTLVHQNSNIKNNNNNNRYQQRHRNVSIVARAVGITAQNTPLHSVMVILPNNNDVQSNSNNNTKHTDEHQQRDSNNTASNMVLPWFEIQDSVIKITPASVESLSLRAHYVAIQGACEYIYSHAEDSGVVYTTSLHAYNCLTRYALEWSRTGWITRRGVFVEHADILAHLVAFLFNPNNNNNNGKTPEIQIKYVPWKDWRVPLSAHQNIAPCLRRALNQMDQQFETMPLQLSSCLSKVAT